MAKIVGLDGPALAWARQEFASYYRDHPVAPPPRLARREFAAFPFARETVMRRHAVLPTPGDFEGFLRETVPRHVYYSSAYYRYPDHPSMAAKEWLGADLIFDLDADHLRQSEGLGYAAQLDRVKEQLKRLYDDFLLGDFGIDPRESEIVFSGGRGYHVHVRDRKFQSLSSGERRELVDYLQGTDIEPADAVVEERRSDGLGGRSRRFRTLSPPDAPGWRGRTTRGLLELLDRWEHQGPDVAAAELERTGIDASDARRLARLLLSESGGRRFRESLRLDALSRNVPPQLLSAVLRSATVEVQGETDAPVTTDIHRLIRLPDSLHGGTGFRVVPLDRDRLDAFEPLREAPLPAPAGRTAPVRLLEPVDYPFDPPVVGKAGEAIDLPVPSALFLVLRGEAELRA